MCISVYPETIGISKSYDNMRLTLLFLSFATGRFIIDRLNIINVTFLLVIVILEYRRTIICSLTKQAQSFVNACGCCHITRSDVQWYMIDMLEVCDMVISILDGIPVSGNIVLKNQYD